LRDLRRRSHRVGVLGNRAAPMNPLRLQSKWSALSREDGAVTLHSIWRYGLNHSNKSHQGLHPGLRQRERQGEPSCGISSSYL
jgi:hypothetical protein